MEIVKVKDDSYTAYEEALLRRDDLLREAERYLTCFIRVFGGLSTEAFRKKIECIRKKKMIAYCQRMENYGRIIDHNGMVAQVEMEMEKYTEQLESMLEDIQIARNAKRVSAEDMDEIKVLYHTLVKKLHPDLHPELEDDPVIVEYWERIAAAYRNNDLKSLKELAVLTAMHLDKNGTDGPDIEIDCIEDKIRGLEAEIEEITNTKPYLYKDLLEDEAAIEVKKNDYRAQIASFERYSEELDQTLDGFEIRKVLS